ncbi:MAG: hypothetical protein QOE90_525 [Thermoplasmata archaeon]|jgi:hypothetical protein|nr:hypothetical protein [Thermoplasmata archaeon]
MRPGANALRVRLLLLALVLALAGCLSAPAPAPSTSGSGIFGTAMLGPTCPVERAPPDPACADRPFAGNLTVTSADGATSLARFVTRADGTFNVTLAPGTYAIRGAENPNGLPRCASDGPFTVRAGAWTEVNVSCDTGIR